jgi:signal transduction histidine kinase
LYSLNYFHQQDLEKIEETLLNELTSEIDATMTRFMETFQVVVTYSQVTDISDNDQELLLQQLMDEFPELMEASFISVSEDFYGQEKSKLNRLKEGFADETDLVSQAKMDKFKQAAERKFYIGPVYYTLKGPMVTVSSPVKNTPKEEEGLAPSVIMVLTGEIRLLAPQKAIMQTMLGNSGYVYLRDNNGFVIADSIGKMKVGDAAAFSAQEQMASYKNYQGEEVYGMSRMLSTLNASVIAEWPVSDADQILNEVKKQVAAASVLVLLAAGILSFIMAIRIVRPIKQLQAGAVSISEGKFDQKVEINTKDELEELGEEFNKMSKGLKRLQELKNEFVFVAAHELKAPVTVIKGYLSMIMGGDAGKVSDKVKEFLDPVDQANKNLLKLVEDLLEVARSDAGRIEIKVKPVDIAPVVESVAVQFAGVARQKQMDVVYQKSAEQTLVMADPDKVKEIAMNLVSNSVKYTLASGVVKVWHEVKDGMFITYVKDQGIGISKENQKKLFEKFYRIKSIGTEEVPGTGLGLWIVKELLEKMGGWIKVESEGDSTAEQIPEDKRGCTFTFALPLASK